MISQTEFSERRQRLLDYIGKDGIAILFAAPEHLRNGDNHHPYRQYSHFYYLTGFNEPEAVAILMPGCAEGEYVLFNRPNDPLMEIWNGRRAGQDGAGNLFHADQAFAINEFTQRLPGLLQGRSRVYTILGHNPDHDQIVLEGINRVKTMIRSGIKAPTEIINLEDFLGEQRLIKSIAEIAIMREAAEISAKAHRRAMQACRPGLKEYHLEAELLYEFTRNGSRAVAYESIVGAGSNACILHYRENNALLAAGDLVLVDAGSELQGYAADITRTFPVNGRFSPEQGAIYEVVLAAQLAGIEQVRPGNAWHRIQEAIIQVLTAGLVELEILKGDIASLITAKAYLPFYMHNSGHWLGLDVHDVGAYKINAEWRALEPGMVLTVEPGLYISPHANVDPKWWHIGVRIEDDVLVTEQGCEILSKDVPKTVAEIETLMAQASNLDLAQDIPFLVRDSTASGVGPSSHYARDEGRG